MDLIKLALVKVYPQKGNLASNHTLLMEILSDIAPHHPDVVITPECFLDGYVATEPEVTAQDLVEFAIEPGSSGYIQETREYARQQECWLIEGCTRCAPQGVYNTALVIDRSGRIAGMYHKTHLQTHDVKFLPGNTLPVFAADFGTFGVLICADRRWPETVRTLALKGARIIFNPTYGQHNERNLAMMQTRSYESEVVIAFAHPEQSLVTGPCGEILCNNTSAVERFALCEVDLLQVDRAREGESAHLRDRRPNLYY